ncbi:MAG: hypothetical protein HY681_08335 [Chloroflexi bacterium]|nr:hypothetical protein [Chloroflexota bacterium]
MNALVISSYILAAAVVGWLMLPVKHWPGGSPDATLLDIMGWWAIPWVAAPLGVLSMGWVGHALAARRHRWAGLALVWFAVAVLVLSGLTFALPYGPYFWPATVPLLIAAVRATARALRQRPA